MVGVHTKGVTDLRYIQVKHRQIMDFRDLIFQNLNTVQKGIFPISEEYDGR